MKICLGFHNRFRIQADNCLFCCSSYFGAKKKLIFQHPHSHFRGHAQCSGETFPMLCRSIYAFFFKLVVKYGNT